MTLTRDELREKYLAHLVRDAQVVDKPVENTEQRHTGDSTRERAFVVRGEQSGRTVISAPLREIASKNEGFTYLRGRFVEADRPNGNNAMWTTDDLRLGEATVAGGPLNWLHDDTKIIGTLLDGRLVSGREAAAEGVGNHIVSTAAVWRFLYPNETATIERAAAASQLWYSMECVSRKVVCTGDAGCGEEFDYAPVIRNEASVCSHLRERASIRHYVDPVFLGGAIIVPPVKPGWSQADVQVVRQAAQLTEEHNLTDELTKPEAEAMVAQIISWANRA